MYCHECHQYGISDLLSSLVFVFLPSDLYLFRYFSVNFILIYALIFFLDVYLLFRHSLFFLNYFSLFIKHSVVYTECFINRHNSKIMLNYLFQKVNRENLWNTPNFRQYITGSKCILLAVVLIFVFRLIMNSYE